MGISDLTPETHRTIGVELFNKTWEMMDKSDRSDQDNALMLDYAHGSALHWSYCGTEVNRQRAYWLLSRVYAVQGVGQMSVFFAKLCREVTESFQREMADFDIAFSFEALARAYAVNGDKKLAKENFLLAEAAGREIKDAEDRKIFDGDLRSEIFTNLMR